MKINEEDLKLIIENVLNKLEGTKLDIKMQESLPISTLNQEGIFDEVNAAVDAAEVAHLELVKLTLEKRREIIRSIRKIIISNLE